MLTYLNERLRLLRLHMGADGADALEAMLREVDAYAETTDATLATAEAFAGAEAIVTLTTAQVKALNTTPITLVAAPGVGKALILDEATPEAERPRYIRALDFISGPEKDAALLEMLGVGL
jgi:hypothetical protein